MGKVKVGDKFHIQCYKHNGELHNEWSEAVLLDIKKDYLVFGNNKTEVKEVDGSTWKTKEPAILYFFKKDWFNLIVQLKKEYITYYCNIASPFLIEDNTIKYIDYDLDLRIFPTGKCKILDQKEYKYHKKKMHYNKEIDLIVHESLNELIQRYKNKDIIFDKKRNLNYYEIYKKVVQKS